MSVANCSSNLTNLLVLLYETVMKPFGIVGPDTAF
jgi:hypothetical protein